MTSIESTNNLSPRSALIVDDELANRKVLSKFLSKLGFNVFDAENGAKAIEVFQQEEIDIILMDVMMPEVDGIEATIKIKSLCVDTFVPIIFLTALTSEEEMAKCIDAGGDDFISKPFTLNVLKAKIHSLERIRNFHLQVKEANRKLELGNEIAKSVFSEAIFKKNIHINEIQHWVHAKDCFNNQIFLISRTPSNGINILLGHINAQGLASAVGALPSSEVFRAMSHKGFAPNEILSAINSKLNTLLPDDMNLSAVFIHIDPELQQAFVYNCNLPDVLIFDSTNHKIVNKISSLNYALGSKKKFTFDDKQAQTSINESNVIVFSSISISQQTRLLNYDDICIKGSESGNILNHLKESYATQLDSENNFDNFTVVELPIIKSLIPENDELKQGINAKAVNPLKYQKPAYDNQVNFSLSMRGRKLKSVDPIPHMLNYLQSVADISAHQEALFTILTELYVNALDHGVLGLESSLKKSADGFMKYFELKKERLETINNGFVNINLALETNNTTNQLIIMVSDSGNGFDIRKMNLEISEELMFSGRGMALINGLCDSIEVVPPGNEVIATYRWRAE